MTQRAALIVGAGAAGLSAAWWLGQIGWRPLVIERAPDLRTDGYMLGLSGPGYEVARRMGILSALQSRARDIRENVYLGRDGRELLRLRYHEFLSGLEWVTLPRTELVAVLYDAAWPRADIRFGTTLQSYSDRVDHLEATLSDGSRHRLDLLIGCDGVGSRLRGQLFGEDSACMLPLGYRAAAFQVPDTLGLGSDFLSYSEPGRHAEFYTLAEGRLATLYIWRSEESAPVPPAERRAVLKAAFHGAHPDALRWIELLPDSEPLFFDSMTLVDLPQWSRGRVLLLGDAAHCLTLVSGQGAGIAMTSACLLAQELAKGDIDAALAAHAERLRPVVARLQARSRKMAAVFIPATAWAFALRNLMMRWLPRRVLGWYFQRNVRSEILAASTGLPIAPRCTRGR